MTLSNCFQYGNGIDIFKSLKKYIKLFHLHLCSWPIPKKTISKAALWEWWINQRLEH